LGILPPYYSDEKEIVQVKEYMQNIDTKMHDLHGFVGSDWAGDNKHRRSVSGRTVLFGGAVVVYKSKLQRTIATSSTEAGFSAACDDRKSYCI